MCQIRKLRLQTPRLFNWTDPFKKPGNEKRLSGLVDDWPEHFKLKILPSLPVSLLIPFFKANIGRPSKDILTMLGVYILQEMWDYTDSEVLRHLKYDDCFKWALDIQELNDTTLYVSPKTLYNFRLLIKENDLESKIFNQTTRDLIEQFEVD
ncbi:MAG: transposase, partial [Deltaproteobacteria bacterium]|nr:transposase [Deltaproteobacteria bacterium]